MNLEAFQDIPFDDHEAFEDFRLSLQMNHDKIAQVMFAAGQLYKTYPLIDSPEHSKDWQQNLQQELQSIFTLRNLTGLPDFASVDLDRQDDFEDFMQLLINVERQVNQNLGIV